MIPDKVKYIVTHDVTAIARANNLLQNHGVDIPLGEHVIIAKQKNKLRGAISLYPDWRKIGRVTVGPVFADSPIILMRLGEAMEIELTRLGISFYYMFADAKDVKLQKAFEKLGLVFVGSDNNNDPWYRRDIYA